MIVKLLAERHLECLSLKGSCREAHLTLHMSKCHIVGNHMHWLKCNSSTQSVHVVRYCLDKASFYKLTSSTGE